MIKSFYIEPSGDCSVVINENNNDTTIIIDAEKVNLFLNSHGDGITSYKEDLEVFVNAIINNYIF